MLLPIQIIVKPSGQSHADRVPGHMQSSHLSVGQSLTGYPGAKVESPYNAFKVYETSAGEEEELQQLLTAQSEVESLGVVKLADPVRSIEDRRSLAVMERTTKKLEVEDAYVSGLLWREEDSSLPNSYDMAVWRLQSLQKKLSLKMIPKLRNDMQSQSRMTLRRVM